MAIGIMTALLAIATAMPFMPLAHGIVRIGDFPRQQILFVAAVLLFLSILTVEQRPSIVGMEAVLLAVIAVQLYHVLPFTRLWRPQSARPKPGESGLPLRLLACNVKMSNRRYGDLIRQVRDADPDIFVLMEVDDGWKDAMSDLLKSYPHVVARPQDNSYGMVLASKLALSNTDVECLLTDGVPSIITDVVGPDGERFRLYSIHPEPPVPHRGTEGRDGETALVALMTREETLPVLVTGDLNDVAWSRTTDRFRKVSELLDPRIGRTVFSTFDARYPLIRWPLDHLFHSAEFRLVAMKRLEPCGSDHFPVLFDLLLCPSQRTESAPEKANGNDIDRASKLVDEARKRQDQPIGSDWEN